MGNRYAPQDVVNKCNLQFSVPIYQRLFAWRRKEVSKLLFDLKEHFDKSENHSPYYLGMMTVVSNHREGYDLIDGQQRFTVMMLMGIVLRDYDGRWETFLRRDDGFRLEFTARSADNDYIKNLINREACDYVNKEMEDAIKCIREFCNASDKETGLLNNEDRTVFAKNVFEHLTFFLAQLPEDYLKHPESLNKYFEVMNSAGKGLEQHEILKVELLRGQPDQEHLTRMWNLVSRMNTPVIKREENVEVKKYAHLFEEQIGRYRNDIYSDDDKNTSSCPDDSGQTIKTIEAKPLERKEQMYESREDSLLTFPELLLLVLDLTLDEEKIKPDNFSEYQFYQQDKLLSNFEKFKFKMNVKAFYERMIFVRTLLDYYVIRRDFVDGQSSYNLIYRAEEDKEGAHARLRQYQSMLYVSTDFYRWLKPFVKYLMEEKPANAGTMLDKLKTIDHGIHKLPGSSTDWCYGEIDRYWFWRLDYCLWDKRETLFKEKYAKYAETAARYVFRENRSIEHLHPQDQSNNEQWSEDAIDAFGNLAMISQSFNSTQSNDHVQIKFARIQEQIDNRALQSIKLLVMCMDADFDYRNWTPELAQKHEQRMIDMLKNDVE